MATREEAYKKYGWKKGKVVKDKKGNVIIDAKGNLHGSLRTPGANAGGNSSSLPSSQYDSQLDKNAQTLFPDNKKEVEAGGNLGDYIFDESKAPQLTTEFTDLDNEILNRIRSELTPSVDEQRLHDLYFGDRLNGLTPEEQTAIQEQGSSEFRQANQDALNNLATRNITRHLQGGVAAAPAVRLQQDYGRNLEDLMQRMAVENINIKDRRLGEAQAFDYNQSAKRSYWTNALSQTGTSLEQRYDQNRFINNQVLQGYRAGQVGSRLSGGQVGQSQDDAKKAFELMKEQIDALAALKVPEVATPNFGSFTGDSGLGFDISGSTGSSSSSGVTGSSGNSGNVTGSGGSINFK